MADRLKTLKTDKSNAKRAYTKTKSRFLVNISVQNIEREEVVALFEQLVTAFDKLIEACGDLTTVYQSQSVPGHEKKEDQLLLDALAIEDDFHTIEIIFNDFLKSRYVMKTRPKSKPGGAVGGATKDVDRSAGGVTEPRRIPIEKEVETSMHELEKEIAEMDAEIQVMEKTIAERNRNTVAPSVTVTKYEGKDRGVANKAMGGPKTPAATVGVSVFAENETAKESGIERMPEKKSKDQAETATAQQTAAPPAGRQNHQLNPEAPPYGPVHASTPKWERTYKSESPSFNTSFDPTRHLSRVQIPKFNGDKKQYQSWRAAFMSCVDSASCTPEYKLLRLRECLQGDALCVIDGLGHYLMSLNILSK
jgi:hypothetical protein